MASMYTLEIWQAIFEILPNIEVNGKKVGMYHQSFLHKGKDNVLRRFNTKEIEQIIKILHETLIDKNLFKDKKPKSWCAIGQQLAWVLTEQSFLNFPNNKIASIQQKRLIAYSTGWMRMQDIIFLESLNFPKTVI